MSRGLLYSLIGSLGAAAALVGIVIGDALVAGVGAFAAYANFINVLLVLDADR